MEITVNPGENLEQQIVEQTSSQLVAKVGEIKLPDPLVDVKAACKFLGCSRSHFDNHYMAPGSGFPYHGDKGKQLQFRISEISEWLDSRKQYA